MKAPELWSRAWSRDRGSRSLCLRERGASAVEYGLLIAGIAALIAAAVFAFGGGSTGMFQDSCKTILADRTDVNGNAVGSCD